MSNTNKPSSEKGDSDQDKNKDSSKKLPDKKVTGLLEQLEVFAMQHKGGSSSIDVNRLSSEQIDVLLDLMMQNEQNLSNFHTERIRGDKEVKLKEISAGTIDKRTLRYLLLGILAVFSIITLLILFYKEDYFSEWLAFMSGIGFGGLGGAIGLYYFLNEKKPYSDNEEDPGK